MSKPTKEMARPLETVSHSENCNANPDVTPSADPPQQQLHSNLTFEDWRRERRIRDYQRDISLVDPADRRQVLAELQSAVLSRSPAMIDLLEIRKGLTKKTHGARLRELPR